MIEVVYVGPESGDPPSAIADAAGERVSITTVGDAAALLERIDGDSIDCVVSEYDLPDATGVDLLRAVRRRQPDLPFVLVGEAVDGRVASEAISAGVTACVTRPSRAPANRSGSSIGPTVVERPGAEGIRLGSFLEFAETLVEASTSEEVCEATLDAIERSLGVPVAATFLYDETGNALRPFRWTTAAEGELADEPVPVSDVDPAWRAFVENEHVLVRTVLPRPAEPTEDASLARGVVLPLEGHGVLLAGTTTAWETTGADLDAARTVALATRHALTRVTLTDQLSESRRTVADHEETVDRLRASASLGRDVERAIVESTTREGLEQSICDRLVRHEPYAFAWIGDYDVVEGGIEPRAWAGSEKSYLAAIGTGADEAAESGEPLSRAVELGEAWVEQRLVGEPPIEGWRREAVRRGYRSVLSLPIHYRGIRYGGLSVYSDRVSAFDRIERSVLDGLGDRLGHAINAIELKRGLVERAVVELEFDVTDPAITFVRWAQETGCEFAMERVIGRVDGSFRCFFVVEGLAPEAVSDLANRSSAVVDTRLVADRDGRSLFSCTLTEESLAADLLEYGAVPTAMTADGETARVVVELPSGSDVRQFVEAFQARYAGSSLVRRRDRERTARTREGFEAELEGRLTDRQLETLQTAYVSGYFETPRDRTGEEVAELLGITQPTFNHHLRAALRKLLSMLFEGER